MGLDLALQGLWQGASIGLAGLGFALIFLTAKELHFAFGITVAIGGYLVYAMYGAGVPFAVAAVAAVVVTGVLGALVRYVLYRRLGDHLAVLLFSFGLAIIAQNVLQLKFGATQRSAPYASLSRVVELPGTDVRVRVVQLVGAALFLVIFLALAIVIRKTRIGLGLIAVMRDPEMAELVGVRPEQMRVLAYLVGSGLAGLAGALQVVESGVSPGAGFELLLFAVIATLLAGKHLLRAGLAGVALGVALSLAAWPLPAQYQTLTVFGAIIAILFVRMRNLPRIAVR
jgi:branched-chain amino acid transport system permease protein